jgi:hypothetical protein
MQELIWIGYRRRVVGREAIQRSGRRSDLERFQHGKTPSMEGWTTLEDEHEDDHAGSMSCGRCNACSSRLTQWDLNLLESGSSSTTTLYCVAKAGGGCR